MSSKSILKLHLIQPPQCFVFLIIIFSKSCEFFGQFKRINIQEVSAHIHARTWTHYCFLEAELCC